MNSIFKSSLGFHIDLSKIVAISLLDVSCPHISFQIDIQLRDKPIIVGTWMNSDKIYNCYNQADVERFDKEVRQELIDAWIAYNEPRMVV